MCQTPMVLLLLLPHLPFFRFPPWLVFSLPLGLHVPSCSLPPNDSLSFSRKDLREKNTEKQEGRMKEKERGGVGKGAALRSP